MAGENHMFFLYFNGFRLTIGIIACVRIESYAWFQFYLAYNVFATMSLLIYIIFGDGILIFTNLIIRQYFIRFLIGYIS